MFRLSAHTHMHRRIHIPHTRENGAQTRDGRTHWLTFSSQILPLKQVHWRSWCVCVCVPFSFYVWNVLKFKSISICPWDVRRCGKRQRKSCIQTHTHNNIEFWWESSSSSNNSFFYSIPIATINYAPHRQLNISIWDCVRVCVHCTFAYHNKLKREKQRTNVKDNLTSLLTRT